MSVGGVQRSDYRSNRFSARPWGQLLARLAIVWLLTSPAQAEIISFDNDDWDHGSGPQTGWNNGELTGTTTFGSTTVTITSNVLGSATTTTRHMTRINASYFTGLAFQLVPSTSTNRGSLTNYLRLDFEFSDAVFLDSFTLTDVDRDDDEWYDVVAAEGFVNGLGAVGTGVSANYTFANPTNQVESTRFGLNVARPRRQTGNVQNTPPADVTFDFSQAVTAFSVYYWNFNRRDDNSPTQTIGIRNNEFEVTKATPEPGVIGMYLVAFTVTLLCWFSRRFGLQALSPLQ